MPHPSTSRRAFTLLELIVVLVVLGLLAAIAVPTYNHLKVNAELKVAELSLANIARRAFVAAKADNADLSEADVVEAAATAPLNTAAAAGLHAQGSWAVTFDVDSHSETYGEAHAGISVDGTTLGLAVHGPTVGCAYSRHTAGAGTTWSDRDAEPSSCNAAVALAGPGESAEPAADGFPITANGGDATITLLWDTQGGADTYRVRCWTANLTSAGDTPKIVTATSGDTQTATVAGVENFVTHTCEIDAVTAAGEYTSAPADAVPFTGPPPVEPPAGAGPPSLPPEGAEPAPPSGQTAPGADPECSGPQCLTVGSQLSGLASFVSAHSGTHILYTVDTGTGRLRGVIDRGSAVTSTYLIDVVDAGGSPVDLTAVTDLVAGKHPSRTHPQSGTSPYTVLYASTSTGTVYALSPISGGGTWRAYPVATGLGDISALTYDNCPTAPGSAARAAGTHCVHAATNTGVRIVPLTDTAAVTVEAAWPPQGPANLTAITSNTMDLTASDGNGAWFGAAPGEIQGFHWGSGAALHRVRGIGGSGGVAWMGGQLYFTRTSDRSVYRNNTPPAHTNAARVHVAGHESPIPIAVDGAGGGAGFVNPTRLHWHGNTPNLYVLDSPCVRRLDTSNGRVSTVACPGEFDLTNLERVDTTPDAPVFSPSAAASAIGGANLAASVTADGSTAYFITSQRLADADTDDSWDLYRRSFTDGTVELISDGTNGAPDSASGVRVSADGSRAAYLSGDGKSAYLYTAATGASELLTTNERNMALGHVSDDGSKVSLGVSNEGFDLPGVDPAEGFRNEHVYVYDVGAGTWMRASSTAAGEWGSGGGITGPAACRPGNFTADNTRVVFWCSYTNLVGVGNDHNGTQFDVFVKNVDTGAITRVNESADGEQGNAGASWAAITPSGSHVTFISDATNLVPGDTNDRPDLFVKNVSSGAIHRITGAIVSMDITRPDTYALSRSGDRIAYVTLDQIDPADNVGTADVYTVDLSGAGHQWVSRTGSGTGGAWLAAVGGMVTRIELSENRVVYVAYYPSQAGRAFLATRPL